MKKFNVRKSWCIPDEVSDLKKREILFITAEAAEIQVYHTTRGHEGIKTYPFLFYDGSFITGVTMNWFINGKTRNVQECTYEQVLEGLQKIVRKNAKNVEYARRPENP